MDINPHPGQNSEVKFITTFLNTLYFSARDTANNEEIWVSDGSLQGTSILNDFNPNGPSYPRNLTVVDSLLYVVINNNSIYFSNGDSLFTEVKNSQGFPFGLIEHKGLIYFANSSSLNSLGYELYKIEYDSAILVSDINPNGDSSGELESLSGKVRAISKGNYLYFVADDGIDGFQIWATDGTQLSTQKITTIPNQTQPYIGEDLTILDSFILFTADSEHLWALNTINNSVQMISSASSRILCEFNNKIYFTKNNSELWSTNGSILGTNFESNIAPNECIEFNNSLFCSHLFSDLISIDTSSNIQTVATINPAVFTSANIREFTTLNNKLYFFADDGITDELWFTDGITTQKIENQISSNTHPLDFDISKLITFNNELYFYAEFTENDGELWRYNPYLDSTSTSITFETSYDKLSIYPNPSSDIITISNKNNRYDFFDISSLNGKIILKGELDSNIHINTLNQGFYVVTLYENKSPSKSFKILKK